MDVDFLADYITDVVKGLGGAEIKTLTYRDGGVELAPGNVAKCIVPEWLKDQTIEINLTGGEGSVKSNYGESEVSVSIEPETHQVTTNHEVTTIKDNDPSHKITITRKGLLKDGDKVYVAKFTGNTKYLILAKAEVNDA